MENERRLRQERILQQEITRIQRKLERGTEVLREGHRIKNLNPEGTGLEVPLTDRKRWALTWNLAVLTFRLECGKERALPSELNSANPNHHRSLPERKIDFSRF